MSQTSQTARLPLARVGMVDGSIYFNRFDGTKVAQIAVPAGRFCVQGTNAAKQATLPTANTINLIGAGFAVLDTSKGSNGTAAEYAIGDPIPLLTAGRFYADAEVAMAVTDLVFVRFGAAVAADRGKVRNDVAGGEAAQLFGCRVVEACTAAGPVLLELVSVATDYS